MVFLCLLPGGNGSVLILLSLCSQSLSPESFLGLQTLPTALTRDSKLGFSKDRRGI